MNPLKAAPAFQVISLTNAGGVATTPQEPCHTARAAASRNVKRPRGHAGDEFTFCGIQQLVLTATILSN